MNWGYSENSHESLNELGSSFLYSANFETSFMSVQSSHLMTSSASSSKHFQTAYQAIRTAEASWSNP